MFPPCPFVFCFSHSLVSTTLFLENFPLLFSFTFYFNLSSAIHLCLLDIFVNSLPFVFSFLLLNNSLISLPCPVLSLFPVSFHSKSMYQKLYSRTAYLFRACAKLSVVLTIPYFFVHKLFFNISHLFEAFSP